MYTLDTNAIIYYLNGELSAARILEDVFGREEPTYVSAITELELFSHRLLTEDDSDTITRLLASTVIVPVDSQLARFAGFLRRQTPRLKAADSAIAATALLTHTTLITRNIRDFQQIDTLQLLEI